jgi:EmrB/QacA subfamily drug resistance transporter
MNQSSTIEKNSTLLVASVASFITPFMGSAVNIALPSIGTEFASSAILLSWVSTAYLLAVAIFLIPFGRVADIYGRKKIFLYGILLFSLASLICGFSPTIYFLIVFRVVQAVGSAMIFSSSVAIITAVFPPKERGRAMGIAVGAVYFGLSLGPFMGGILTQYWGWQSLFFFVVPLGLLAVYFVITKLQNEWADAQGESFDWWGAILYAIALFFIMIGFSKLTETRGASMLLIGLAFLALFIGWELHQKLPLINLKIFQSNITFRYSNLAALINYSATFAIAFLLSFYLQYFKGLSPQDAGFILVAQPVVMAVFSPWAGHLSDRFEARIISSLGMVLLTIGLIFLAFISAKSSLLYIVLVLILLGFGFALFSSPNSNSIMSSVDKKQLGIASAILGTMRMIGQMLSMGIAMMLFSIFIGDKSIGSATLPSLLQSIQVAFIIFAVLCFIGIFASLARGKMYKS